MTYPRSFIVMGLLVLLLMDARAESCRQMPTDIVILLDTSGSMTTSFSKEIDLISSFINSLDIGSDKVRVSVVTYASAVQNQFYLKTYPSKQSLLDAVSKIQAKLGTSRLERGIKYVTDVSFTPEAGDRADAPDVLIIMTDGNSTDQSRTKNSATVLHSRNITTFVLGIGQTIGWCDLAKQHLATDPTLLFGITNKTDEDILQIVPYTCNEQSPWTDWTPCLPQCGNGYQNQTSRWLRDKSLKTRTRKCGADQGGGEIIALGQWSNWTECSTGCGIGIQNRTRQCYRDACNENLYEEKQCNRTYGCLVYMGTYGEWSDWGPCKTRCGLGIQKRVRKCHAGKCTGPSLEERSCFDTSGCHIGKLGQWTSWSACSSLCGNGTQVRNRTCSTLKCNGSLTETRDCYDRFGCPVYSGSLGQWSPWGPCPTHCGSGTRKRTRKCYTGICNGLLQDSGPCTDYSGCFVSTVTDTTSSSVTSPLLTTSKPHTTFHGISTTILRTADISSPSTGTVSSTTVSPSTSNSVVTNTTDNFVTTPNSSSSTESGLNTANTTSANASPTVSSTAYHAVTTGVTNKTVTTIDTSKSNATTYSSPPTVSTTTDTLTTSPRTVSYVNTTSTTNNPVPTTYDAGTMETNATNLSSPSKDIATTTLHAVTSANITSTAGTTRPSTDKNNTLVTFATTTSGTGTTQEQFPVSSTTASKTSDTPSTGSTVSTFTTERTMSTTHGEIQQGTTDLTSAETIRPTEKRTTASAFGMWTDWSGCSTSCGDGTQHRTRMCYGHCQGSFIQIKPCTEESGCKVPTPTTTRRTTESTVTSTASMASTTSTGTTTLEQVTTITGTLKYTTKQPKTTQPCEDISVNDCADSQALHFICADPASVPFCRKSCNKC